MSTSRGLLLLGGMEAAALGLLAWWPGPALPVPGIPLFLAAFGAYVVATYASDAQAGGPDSISTLTVIWGGALLLRLVLLPAAPELSDDVFRYLWDGHVQLQGVNPYRFAPADPALAEIRTPWHARVNHPEVSTIYPPVAQMAFLLIALLGGGILQAKLLWVGLDLATGWVLFRVARRTGRRPLRVLVLYLWSPLLVVETAWSAHLEPLGLLAMAALLAFTVGAVGGVVGTGDEPEPPEPDATGTEGEEDQDSARPLPGRAGVAAAAAALTKFAPVAALPPLLRRLGLRLGAAFVATSLVVYLPYLGAGSGLWEGLFTYVRDWRFMVGPFSLLESALPGRWPPRLAAAAVVGGVVLWATWRRFTAERSLFWILGAGLLLSPTVHPWYVLWILPFAALRGSGPWILLSGLVFLGYWGLGTFQDTGAWPQPLWLRLLVWVPPLAWLAVRELGPALGGRAREPHEAQRQIPGSEEE